MDTRYIHSIVQQALAEDLGSGDVTTDPIVPKSHRSSARIIVKSSGVICGLALAKEAFRQLDPRLRFQIVTAEGRPAKVGQTIVRLQGSTRALLKAERTALNFLSYLSGIAGKTHAFVQAVKPYKCKILDTRKTTPLLRPLERYAVCCGGGTNHRFNLSDMAMLKDNHRIFAADRSLKELVETIRRRSNVKIELEVDTLKQLSQALQAKPDVILLDNMTPAQVRKAVVLRHKNRSNIPLEASGGITLRNVRAYAASGVERISVGSLTHSRQGLDVSLEFDR